MVVVLVSRCCNGFDQRDSLRRMQLIGRCWCAHYLYRILSGYPLVDITPGIYVHIVSTMQDSTVSQVSSPVPSASTRFRDFRQFPPRGNWFGVNQMAVSPRSSVFRVPLSPLGQSYWAQVLSGLGLEPLGPGAFGFGTFGAGANMPGGMQLPLTCWRARSTGRWLTALSHMADDQAWKEAKWMKLEVNHE